MLLSVTASSGLVPDLGSTPAMSLAVFRHCMHSRQLYARVSSVQQISRIYRPSASVRIARSVPACAEQERIVAAIEEQFSRLDAGVAALERARQNLKRMRAASYQQLQ